MKTNHIINFWLISLSLALMTACQDDNLIENVDNPTVGKDEIALHVRMGNYDNPETRAQVQLGNNNEENEFFLWNEGDSFTLYSQIDSSVSSIFTISGYDEENPTAEAVFVGKNEFTDGSNVTAIYPQQETAGEGSVTFILPESEMSDGGEADWKNYMSKSMYMYANAVMEGSNTKLVFNHLCAMIRVSHTNTTGSEQILTDVAFTGSGNYFGTEAQYSFADKMRTTLSQDIGASVSIQTLGTDSSFRIKVDQGAGGEDLKKISDTISSSLETKFSEGGKVVIDSVEQVGPQVGKDLKRQAFLAVLYAVIGILIYVAIRFELMSATSSIIALIHDIILTLGVIIAVNVTFDLTVLAALLTVVGYSLNDKIVIFDRIRERARMDEHKTLMESINISINETLSRTILTSTSTLLAVISLAVFGGEVIQGFAIVMIAGIIIGTYSSIGIASSLVYNIKMLKGKKTVK